MVYLFECLCVMSMVAVLAFNNLNGLLLGYNILQGLLTHKNIRIPTPGGDFEVFSYVF